MSAWQVLEVIFLSHAPRRDSRKFSNPAILNTNYQDVVEASHTVIRQLLAVLPISLHLFQGALLHRQLHQRLTLASEATIQFTRDSRVASRMKLKIIIILSFECSMFEYVMSVRNFPSTFCK